MKSMFVNRDTFKRLRIQFDAIGLTENAGWDEQRIYAFVNTPNWFQQHTWTRKQSDECYKKMVAAKLLTQKEIAMYDLDKGWRDAE